MHPPVVQHLGHMGGTAGALQQPQEQVVVLAAIALRAFAAHSIPQCLFEHGQMADVVAAQQVIRRIVRREVGRDGFTKESRNSRRYFSGVLYSGVRMEMVGRPQVSAVFPAISARWASSTFFAGR